MSYTICNVYPLGIEYTGIAIRAQLYSSTNVAVGSAISSGFYERGGAQGIWAHTLVVPDAHVGWCDIYDNAAPTVVLASFAINPQEVENTDAKTSLTATAASLATVATYVDTEVAAIKAKTDNLPSDPADESSIQATLAAIATYIDTEVAAIKAKTDNLPSDPADESSIQASIAALSAAVTVIDNFLDTEITAMPAEVWSYATRTLTMTAAQITAAMEGEPLPIYKSVTFDFTFTGLTIPADWAKIWFTLKKSRGTTDSLADIQIVITNGGHSDDGIAVLNAAASTVTTKPYGALVINQAAGTAALTIQDDATVLMTGKYSTQHLGVYDLKVKDASGATVILTESTATLEWAVTRQI